MRVMVGQSKDYKGMAYVYDTKRAETYERIMEYTRIAEIEVNETDVIYVAFISGDMKVTEDGIIKAPDFLFDANVMNTSTNWRVIEEGVEEALLNKKNVSIKAFVKIEDKFVCGCNLLITNTEDALLTFRRSTHYFNDIINYYERRFNSGNKEE